MTPEQNTVAMDTNTPEQKPRFELRAPTNGEVTDAAKAYGYLVQTPFVAGVTFAINYMDKANEQDFTALREDNERLDDKHNEAIIEKAVLKKEKGELREENERLKAELREQEITVNAIGEINQENFALREAFAIIPPIRLRALASYLDDFDKAVGETGHEVQDDLLRLADTVDALLHPKIVEDGDTKD